MLQVEIPAAQRTGFGKGASRQLRMAGQTPAIMYSRGKDAKALQLDAALLYKNLFEIHGRNAVVSLSIAGDEAQKHHVLVKEIQKDPVTDHPIHVDFLEIALDNTLDLKVPVVYSGKAKGVDLGGELHVFKHEVTLRGCPLDIPDTIEVDVTPLERGSAGITYGDLAIPAQVELLDEKGTVCVSVS